MEKLKRYVTRLYIDILVLTIRISVFATLLLSTNLFGILGSTLSSFLIGLIYLIVDIYIFRLDENDQLSIPFYKRVRFRLITRFLLTPILGLAAGYGCMGIIKSISTTNSFTEGFLTDFIFLSIFSFFTLIDLLYVMTKYWSYKANKDLFTDYKVYFKMFNDRYLPRSDKDSFFKIIETLNNNEEKFNEIRSMMELILKRLNKSDLNILPDEMFNNHGVPNLEFSLNFLGKKVQKENNDNSNLAVRRIPDHVFYCMRFIKDTTSAFSHHNEHKRVSNCYKACVLSLLECMIYLKNIVDDRK